MAGSGTDHLRDDALVRVVDLVVEFDGPKHSVVHAVSGISFDVDRGETVGIVGESGCGKSTTARAVMRLERATSGRIEFAGVDLTGVEGKKLRAARRTMQMIFQDPASSLNPSRRVGEIVREGLDIWGTDHRADTSVIVEDMLDAVGLGGRADVQQRRPHEFSGGECQRICLARALAMQPEVLILDEPVSALDVSVQAQILNLLERLREQFGLTMLFISHDMAVVKSISDRVVVLYLGKICEIAETDRLYEQPAHPYSRALLASIPSNDLDLPPAEQLISGEPPSPLSPPPGCRFAPRCPLATERCRAEEPILRLVDDGQWVACHYPVRNHVTPRRAQRTDGAASDTST